MAGNKRVKGDGKGRQGGRKKDTPNNITSEMKILVARLVRDTYELVVEDIRKIEDPAKRVQIWTQLSRFVLPQMSSVEVKEDPTTKRFKDELDELEGR